MGWFSNRLARIWLLVFSLVFNVCSLSSTLSTSRKLAYSVFNKQISMPSVSPSKNDDYLCTAISIGSNDAHIIKYVPFAEARRVHHLLLFGCAALFDDNGHLYPSYWSCSHSTQLCQGMTIMYAWGKNAPPLTLPPDVGFKVGEKASINYLILQVHYAFKFPEGVTDNSGVSLDLTYSPQKYMAGIHLLSARAPVIPPYKPKFSVDINCVLGGHEMHPFAYRVHAHSLGVVVTGYKYSQQENSWTLLAKGNPQWPQTFYPMDRVYTVSSEEVLAARCTYNSSLKKSKTSMGNAAEDEMCNLYIMYYTKPKGGRSFTMCVDLQIPQLVALLPTDSDQPLPPNPLLEEIADGSQIRALSVDKYSYTQSKGWPIGAKTLGQITAVAVDKYGNAVIFHRGSHVWNGRSFNYLNIYKPIGEGPIAVNTVLVVDPKSKKIINSWGSDLFYLPHGLSFDANGSVWLTDVALHQVFKFTDTKPGSQPAMVLGQRFKPGSDETHFCKPTSAAVNSLTGDVYVADGYCNNRVIRFSASGKFLNQWGHADPLDQQHPYPPPGALEIPHKTILMEDKQLACVADREHGRVQCFQTPHGQFKFEINRREFGGRLFSISYSPLEGGLLYAVSGSPMLDDPGFQVKAFVFNVTSQKMIGSFAPGSGTFSQPHDIAASDDCSQVFVVEIGPNNLYKFEREDMRPPRKLSENVNIPNISPDHIMETHNLVQTVDSPATTSRNGTFTAIPIILTASKSSTALLMLTIPIACVLLISCLISCRKDAKYSYCSGGHCGGWLRGYRSAGKSQEKFDLGRLLADPEKSGFNRVALDSDDEEGHSDSEIEEFNVASARKV